jgi:hypothetical protein
MFRHPTAILKEQHQYKLVTYIIIKYVIVITVYYDMIWVVKILDNSIVVSCIS